MDCSKCKKQICLKEGKPCADVEKTMRREGIRGLKWIRPQLPRSIRNKLKKAGERYTKWREIPFSTLNRGEDKEI